MSAKMWNLPNKSADLLLFLVKCFAMVASPVIALLVVSFNCGVYKDQPLQMNEVKKKTSRKPKHYILPHVSLQRKTTLSLIYNLKFRNNYSQRRYKLARIFCLPLFLSGRSFDHKIHINMMQGSLIPLSSPSSCYSKC